MAVLGDLSDRDGEIILLDGLAHPKNGAAEFNRMHQHV
jgi:alpha-acetolactate decarboxylase